MTMRKLSLVFMSDPRDELMDGDLQAGSVIAYLFVNRKSVL